jgi:hypothetical protein
MRILFLILITTSCIYAQDQNDINNHKKYWYYKWRLNNNFVLVGDCNGCSQPASTRNFGAIKWSDGGIEQGIYLMMLATEYKLLSNNGQNLTEITKEIFYALNQINKMDYYAEYYYGGTPSLNGFYLRSIVNDGPVNSPNDFLGDVNDPHYLHFNSNIVSSTAGIMSNVISDLHLEPDQFGNNLEPAEVSQDQTAYIMGGLRCIAELIPANTTYNGQVFMDGETGLREEAIKIADRIIMYMRNANWCIINPVLGLPVRGGCSTRPTYCFNLNFCGDNARAWAHGFAGTMNKIASQPIISIPYQDAWSMLGGNNAWQSLSVVQNFIGNGDVGEVLTLAASSDSWGLFTKTKIATIAAVYNRQWASLLHSVLDGSNDPTDPVIHKLLLNAAPECGPYNCVNDTLGYASGIWNSPSWFRFAENRDEDHCGDGAGEFNGIDYMVYHNLYYLQHPQDYTAVNQIDLGIYGASFPTILGSFGSHSHPLQFTAFNTLTSSGVTMLGQLFGGADITYRAGTEITLLPGFEVQEGADFRAYIDLVGCNYNTQSYTRIMGDSTVLVKDGVPYLKSNYVQTTTPIEPIARTFTLS